MSSFFFFGSKSYDVTMVMCDGTEVANEEAVDDDDDGVRCSVAVDDVVAGAIMSVDEELSMLIGPSWWGVPGPDPASLWSVAECTVPTLFGVLGLSSKSESSSSSSLLLGPSPSSPIRNRMHFFFLLQSEKKTNIIKTESHSNLNTACKT